MKKIKYYFDIIFINAVKWLYNHSTCFSSLLRKRARKQGEMNLILLELFMAKEPIDVDYWCDRISKVNKHKTA